MPRCVGSTYRALTVRVHLSSADNRGTRSPRADNGNGLGRPVITVQGHARIRIPLLAELGTKVIRSCHHVCRSARFCRGALLV